ncbi:hypothetical protein [Alkalihalobacterium alkalinitrilicum]|uniref:hypothetical protein n=1 Tax=Alkalihalobacterium alkalinitrilicum TaxID=427920 RepID=UPI000994DFA2|nr:hypothetical protein [Alkalihalobacterium alkalinitrilicum]
MEYKAYFLFNLAQGKTVEEYERWSVEVNHPAAKSVESIREFHDYKTVATLDGSKPAYQIIEEIVISDVDQYKKDITAPEMAGFSEEWGSWVSDWFCILTERVA